MPATVELLYLAPFAPSVPVDVDIELNDPVYGSQPHILFNKSQCVEITAGLEPPPWLRKELNDVLGQPDALATNTVTWMLSIRGNDRATALGLPSEAAEAGKWLMPIKMMVYKDNPTAMRINGAHYRVVRSSIECVAYFTELGAGSGKQFVAAGIANPKFSGKHCTFVKESEPKEKDGEHIQMVVVDFDGQHARVEAAKLRPLRPQDSKPVLARPGTSLADSFLARYNPGRRTRVYTGPDGKKQMVTIGNVTQKGTQVTFRDGTASRVPLEGSTRLTELVILCTVDKATTIAASTDLVIDGAVYGLHEADNAAVIVQAASVAALMDNVSLREPNPGMREAALEAKSLLAFSGAA
jgi:hypothetical protein